MDERIFYEIRVKGHLDDTWADWFEGLSVSNGEDGEAVLSGWLPDQAALQGVLNQVSNLGLVLISVNPVQEEDEVAPEDERDPESEASDQDGAALTVPPADAC